MDERFERLQSVTRNYTFLLGWPIGSVGLIYLFWGFCVMLWGGGARDRIHSWLLFPSLAVLWIGLFLTRSRQQKKLGTVKISLSRRNGIELAIAIVLYVVLIRLSGPDFKYLFKVPLEPTLLNTGIILTLMGLLLSFPWRHYLVFGVLLMGAAFLPAADLMPLEQFYRGWTFVIAGIAFLLCGVIDRWLLARNFAALQVQEEHV